MPQIVVTFDIDNKSTSKKQSITIRSSGGLSDTNVQETVISVALRRFSWGAMAGDALMSGVYRVDFRLSGLAATRSADGRLRGLRSLYGI